MWYTVGFIFLTRIQSGILTNYFSFNIMLLLLCTDSEIRDWTEYEIKLVGEELASRIRSMSAGNNDRTHNKVELQRKV